MIWIIGGTSETNHFLRKINPSLAVVVTVATEEGRSRIDHGEVILAGMNQEEMDAFIARHQIKAVVDLSHPYAIQVSNNAREAAQKNGLPYYRYLRSASEIKDAFCVNQLTLVSIIWQRSTAPFFFTTGSKHIPDFQAVRKSNRFIYRILPAKTSLQTCIDHKVSVSDIIAILGPISADLNKAMFGAYQAGYVVMKNAGSEGGTPEKLDACHQLGIQAIVVGRVGETGYTDLDELLKDLIIVND